jgi:phi13 family phage major tail protein
MNIRVGLKGLRVAQIKKDESKITSSTGESIIEYGDIVPLKDVQNVDLTARTQSTDVDADDVTETLAKCSGYDGKVQRTMFTPEEQALLLGETVTDDGVIVSSENDEAPEFATGFTCRVYGGKVLAMWVLRTKYSMGDFSAETSGTDKLNTQSDTLSFKSMARKSDGMWRIYKMFDSEDEAEKFLTLDTLQKIYEKKTAEDTSAEDKTAETEAVNTETQSE